MRITTTLLIATTNKGKIREIHHFLGDLPFTFLTLDDLPEKIAAPEETGETIDDNAILKAKYYAEKTGLMALADDSGLFIDALDGWPGVRSARVAPTQEDQITLVLTQLAGKPRRDRRAEFRVALALYHPHEKTLFVASAAEAGEILEERASATGGFGYDPIFRSQTLHKTFAEMTIEEKNAVSHRGKVLRKMKYILQNQYEAKHIVVPVALIVDNGRLLMSRRNDPHRLEFHGRWEFPGGRIDMGETFEATVRREAAEEVGYTVEPVARLDTIWMEEQSGGGWAYQVFLVPYVCRLTGGDGKHRDAEVLETRWFDLDDVLNHDLLGTNADMYRALLPALKEAVKSFN